MIIAVIDGMGGGIGAQIISSLREELPTYIEILSLIHILEGMKVVNYERIGEIMKPEFAYVKYNDNNCLLYTSRCV